MLAAKIPQRTICEQLHMTRGVLNRYKTLADSQGLSYGVIGRMNDGEIESFLQLPKPTAAPSSQRQVLDPGNTKGRGVACAPHPPNVRCWTGCCLNMCQTCRITATSPFKPYTSHTRRSIPTDMDTPSSRSQSVSISTHTTSASITPIFLGKRCRLTSPAMPCGLPTRRQVS